MQRPCVRAGVLLASVALALSLTTTPGPASAQSTADPAPLRTPHGDPDIGGVFTFRTLTPLQRPVIDAGASAASRTGDADRGGGCGLRGGPALGAEPRPAEPGGARAGVRYQSRAEGGVGGYNEFWYERGVELTRDRRTSLVVDPPSGRIPFRQSYLEAAGIRRLDIQNGFADSYTDRSLSDRCLLGFNAGPPMVSSAYNNNVHILQTPDHVVIFNEMVHNARIVPLDGRPHGVLRQYSGDSRGRWDGDTLVIETRNFLRETSLGGSSRDTRLVERLRRLDPDTVLYEFTVEDPNNFTRPWTAQMPLRRTDDLLFEYACHEGNIGLSGILAGARRLDTQRVSEP